MPYFYQSKVRTIYNPLLFIIYYNSRKRGRFARCSLLRCFVLSFILSARLSYALASPSISQPGYFNMKISPISPFWSVIYHIISHHISPNINIEVMLELETRSSDGSVR